MFLNCRFRTITALAVLFSALVCGCGGNANLASVSGQVLLDGKPLAKAFLIFTPQEGKGAPSFGKTDSDGRYQLVFSGNTKGAWIGKNKVSISTADAISPEKTTPEVVPAAYNVKSDLFRTVESGSNTFDFELQGDGPIKAEKPYTG